VFARKQYSPRTCINPGAQSLLHSHELAASTERCIAKAHAKTSARVTDITDEHNLLAHYCG